MLSITTPERDSIYLKTDKLKISFICVSMSILCMSIIILSLS